MLQHQTEPLSPFTILNGNSDPLDEFILRVMAAEENKCAELKDQSWSCRHCHDSRLFTAPLLIDHLEIWHVIFRLLT